MLARLIHSCRKIGGFLNMARLGSSFTLVIGMSSWMLGTPFTLVIDSGRAPSACLEHVLVNAWHLNTFVFYADRAPLPCLEYVLVNAWHLQSLVFYAGRAPLGMSW